MKQILLLMMLALLSGQTPTETFGTYVNSLPAATALGLTDQLYVRQGGVSKQIPASVITNAPLLQLLNTTPRPATVDLQTSVPVNGFYASGSGAVFQNCPLIGCLAGDHQQSAFYLKGTAYHDASIADYIATFDCNLNSGSTGTSTGPNNFSDARVCFFNSSTTGVNSGFGVWAQAIDLVMGSGDTAKSGTGARINTELDMTNTSANCSVGMANCYVLLLSGLVTNPITSYIAISAGSGSSAGHPGAHFGIVLNGTGNFIADDVDIENSGNANVGICNGCLTPQTHATAGIKDFSTTPVGLWLSGTYSMNSITAPGFAVNADGHISVGFNTAPVAAGTQMANVSSTINFGIYYSNGTPTITAVDGSIDLDATGKLWVHTGGAWAQVTVP